MFARVHCSCFPILRRDLTIELTINTDHTPVFRPPFGRHETSSSLPLSAAETAAVAVAILAQSPPAPAPDDVSTRVHSKHPLPAPAPTTPPPCWRFPRPRSASPHREVWRKEKPRQHLLEGSSALAACCRRRHARAWPARGASLRGERPAPPAECIRPTVPPGWIWYLLQGQGSTQQRAAGLGELRQLLLREHCRRHATAVFGVCSCPTVPPPPYPLRLDVGVSCSHHFR